MVCFRYVFFLCSFALLGLWLFVLLVSGMFSCLFACFLLRYIDMSRVVLLTVSSCVVATLGFDWRHVVSAVTRYRPDRIFLVTASVNEPRVRSAVEEIRRFVESALPGAGVEVVDVDLSSPYDALARVVGFLRGVVEGLRPSVLVFDLSGGPRLLVLLVFTGVLFLRCVVGDLPELRFFVWCEVTGQYHEFGCEFVDFLNVVRFLTCERVEVLRVLLERGSCTLSTLSDVLGRDASTVARQVRFLAELGLVEYCGSRPRVVRLSELGWVLARLLCT